MKSTFLTIGRHGGTKDEKKCCTGSTNPLLSQKGIGESRVLARCLYNNYPVPEKVFTSSLARTRQTWDVIQDELRLSHIVRQSSGALNDRDYGDLTGLTHFQIVEQIGKNKLDHLRKNFDYSIKGVETLRSVYLRVAGQYENVILPLLHQEKDVMVITSASPARMLIKHIENASLGEISRMALHTAEAIVYEIRNGLVVGKNVFQKPAFLQ